MRKLKTIRVVAAIIKNDKGEIFSAERAYGELKGKWEFPGGKIEAREIPKQALIRKIKEKLNAEITVDQFFGMFNGTIQLFIWIWKPLFAASKTANQINTVRNSKYTVKRSLF